jgi:hypothetical protein
MSCEGLLVVHAVSTFAMVGLIWFVQVVHYPMLARHAGEGFGEVEREHCNRTGFVAAPLMLVEVMTAALLMIGGFNPPLFLLAVILLIGA